MLKSRGECNLYANTRSMQSQLAKPGCLSVSYGNEAAQNKPDQLEGGRANMPVASRQAKLLPGRLQVVETRTGHGAIILGVRQAWCETGVDERVSVRRVSGRGRKCNREVTKEAPAKQWETENRAHETRPATEREVKTLSTAREGYHETGLDRDGRGGSWNDAAVRVSLPHPGCRRGPPCLRFQNEGWVAWRAHGFPAMRRRGATLPLLLPHPWLPLYGTVVQSN